MNTEHYGTFINNDIRLIKRSKAARSALIGGVLFLFYGYFSLAKVTTPVLCRVFLRDFVTGGFNFMFGQRVPAWDSSYDPLMMTSKCSLQRFSQSKMGAFCDCHFGLL